MSERRSDDRLVRSVIDLWQAAGHEAVSVRQLSAAASVPVSSIYHHFGSLERLLILAQESAQAQARGWCNDCLDQIKGAAMPSQAFPAFFAAIVDGWTQEQRHLAFAWREAQLLRTATGSGSMIRARWRALWAEFWREAASCFGVAHGAEVIDRLFENESFVHMIRWRRTVDRAALDEFAQGARAWLVRASMPPAPWRDYARAQAESAVAHAPDHDATTARIADAAASLIRERGPAGVTHRAVAERAELTLGVVSHRARTKADLLQIGYRTGLSTAVARLREHTFTLPSESPAETIARLAGFLAHQLGGSSVDALHIAAARDPGLQSFGLQLRYLHDKAARALLQALRPRQAEPAFLEEVLLTSFLTALARRYADCTTDQALEPMRAEIDGLVAIL